MRDHAETCQQLLTPVMRELAAEIICSVRDHGPAITAQRIADIPSDIRLTLTVLLAALVPDDQALEIGALNRYEPGTVLDPVAQIQEVIEARLALEGMPSRHSNKYREPVTPEQAAINQAILVRETAEFDRRTTRTAHTARDAA
ncbi:hypothetical protein AB0F17_42720 [Nonomuraea sp. NPDC026600]|uniref:hypothetical protein n=1 Tax=Nonomuraea sp. NPDC026600 TaxID=3155363 RepID=UPI003404731D